MNNDSQQPERERSGQEDAVLPGLGIFAGFMIGALLSELVVEDWITGFSTIGPGQQMDAVHRGGLPGDCRSRLLVSNSHKASSGRGHARRFHS